MSGTDLVYCYRATRYAVQGHAVSSDAMCGTDRAYGATRRAVLRVRMVLPGARNATHVRRWVRGGRRRRR
eukprot:722193-Rhodomonas_salina.2